MLHNNDNSFAPRKFNEVFSNIQQKYQFYSDYFKKGKKGQYIYLISFYIVGFISMCLSSMKKNNKLTMRYYSVACLDAGLWTWVLVLSSFEPITSPEFVLT